MKKYKFGICGAFDFDEKTTGGQSTKTREFYLELVNYIGKKNIMLLESTAYKDNPIRFFCNFIRLLRHCEQVILFPAQNGIRVMAPIICHIKRFASCKIHYNVIGGWLPRILTKNTRLRKQLKSFDTILVETAVMQRALEDMGLTNVHQLQNFKRLERISVRQIRKVRYPVEICYFSRILRKKGIEDAIEVINRINTERNPLWCKLDIYGPIVPKYQKSFSTLQKRFPREIRYCGVIPAKESTKVLQNYDLQVFPTRYSTEGIPGSIIDSYFAGVPVVASRWNSFDQVVKEGITGLGFTLGDSEDFYRQLKVLLRHRHWIMYMKRHCLEESLEYIPDKVMKEFFNIIGYSE